MGGTITMVVVRVVEAVFGTKKEATNDEDEG
jgi:hypothetical protein